MLIVSSSQVSTYLRSRFRMTSLSALSRQQRPRSPLFVDSAPSSSSSRAVFAGACRQCCRMRAAGTGRTRKNLRSPLACQQTEATGALLNRQARHLLLLHDFPFSFALPFARATAASVLASVGGQGRHGPPGPKCSARPHPSSIKRHD